MNKSIMAVITAIFMLFTLCACGVVETLTESAELAPGMSVSDMNASQRGAFAKQCAQSSAVSPIETGKEALIAGYSAIADEEYLLYAEIKGYASGDTFSEYLIKSYRNDEILQAPCSAFKLSFMVYDYYGSELPYLNDLADIIPVTSEGKELSSLYAADTYTYEPFEEAAAWTEKPFAGWIFANCEEPVSILKLVAKNEDGEENAVYMRLPESDISVLGEIQSAPQSVGFGAVNGDITALRASTGSVAYPTLRNGEYADFKSTLIDLVIDYCGEAVDIKSIQGYAYIADRLDGFPSVYLETDKGAKLVTTGTTEAGKNNLIHIVYHDVTESPGTKADISFKLADKEYTVAYTLGDFAGSYVSAGNGEAATQAGELLFELNKVSYETKIKPSKTGGSYSYYNLDNKDDVFLSVQFSLTNTAQETIRLKDVCTATLTSADGKEMFCQVTAQMPNGKDFIIDADLEPDKTVKCTAFIETPKDYRTQEQTMFVTIGTTVFIVKAPADKAE